MCARTRLACCGHDIEIISSHAGLPERSIVSRSGQIGAGGYTNRQPLAVPCTGIFRAPGFASSYAHMRTMPGRSACQDPYPQPWLPASGRGTKILHQIGFLLPKRALLWLHCWDGNPAAPRVSENCNRFYNRFAAVLVIALRGSAGVFCLDAGRRRSLPCLLLAQVCGPLI